MTRRQLRIAIFSVLFLAVIIGITVWQWKGLEKKVAQSSTAPITITLPSSIAMPESLVKPIVVVPPLPVHPSRPARAIEMKQLPLPPLDLRLLLQPRVRETTGNIELKRMSLPDLFAPPVDGESGMKLGGRLILDDDQKEKEVPMREKVKGAEVRFEMKLN